MRLYMWRGTFRTFGSGHPCRNALDALRGAGHQPEVVRSYGWGLLPAVLNRSEGRRVARRETGRSWLPMLVVEDGETIVGSEDIEAWAQAHPAPTSR